MLCLPIQSAMHNLQDVHGNQRLDNPGCDIWGGGGGFSVGGRVEARSGRAVDKLTTRHKNLGFPP